MNYIEFEKNTDWTIKIHYNRKLRIIKGKSNINKIFELCEKNGYRRINKNCYLEEHIDEIVKEYEKFYNKRKRTIKIYNTINNLMKLKKSSKKIGTTIFISTFVALATINLGDIKNKLEPTEITTENSDNDDDIIYDDNTELPVINITKTTKKSETKNNIETENTNAELESMLNVTTPKFVFECENNEPEKLEEAKKYADIFEKYGKMYGIDPKLLMAIAAQETGGNHYDYLYNYPAVGIMQIERNAHINQEITAFNHLEGKEEKYLITNDSLINLESNIKVAAMLLQIALEANNYNIPLGIQTYNFGTSYIYQSLKMCEDISGIPISEMKNNMEETEWRFYREFLNIGDPYYVEHVLRFIPNETEITIRNRNNQCLVIKPENKATKNKTY